MKCYFSRGVNGVDWGMGGWDRWGMSVSTILGPPGPWGGPGGPKILVCLGFGGQGGSRGVGLGLPYGPARGGPCLVSSYGSPRGRAHGYGAHSTLLTLSTLSTLLTLSTVDILGLRAYGLGLGLRAL